MARLMRQKREIKELFREKIMEKVNREKENFKQRVSEELPSWLSWATKPLAGIVFDLRHNSDIEKGDTGESKAILGFWTILPKEWILINDVVLEPEPEEFAQIDHVLIGPPGVFLIETKTWDGAFQGHKDKWKRKQGNTWVRCGSPTQQNERHARLFKKWMEDHKLYPAASEQILFPVVLFTHAKWLRVEDCSMPVFDSVIALSLYIRSKTKVNVLSLDQIDNIADAIINAKPFTTIQSELPEPKENNTDTDNKIQVQSGKTKNGRLFVKILGNEEEARQVWERYKEEGKNPGQLSVDKFSPNAWFFYYTDSPVLSKKPEKE
ncbi:MAG: NERD domain-containing protein [Syntrophothermus sp.]|uniref:nuclease-related domain-containing protein n=1 Tax=Syntrophothermus sp. TaxID=2736299 RepID=UPI00257CE147|nr:nuclease-related domain-containing protein [Syntrophothermus sp.]NSW82775.1 NERD domain-containing protein [Syntrophothermus sp.]